MKVAVNLWTGQRARLGYGVWDPTSKKLIDVTIDPNARDKVRPETIVQVMEGVRNKLAKDAAEKLFPENYFLLAHS
jgi:flagellar motor component MotA